MTSPEQVRKERIEEIYSFFVYTEVSMIDPIFRKTKTLYPFLKDATAKEYANAVFIMLENKRRDGKENGKVQLDP